MKAISPLLQHLMSRAGMLKPQAQVPAAPEWLRTVPQSDISYLALRAISPRLQRPFSEDRTAQQERGADRLGRLITAHAEAVLEIERTRTQPGQLTTGINGQVGNSILDAGARALTQHDASEGGDSEPKQFVVAAPPGTGKTSHAVALMAAAVRTADQEDLSHPYGCLFVVDQIKKADDMFLQINRLLRGQVAVWSSDHDPASLQPTQMYVPHERRFHVDQLEHRAIAVVTQAFLRGPRGDKARQVIRGDHKVPRELTIFDEQTKEVEVYDIKQSTAIRVKEALEKHGFAETKSRLQPLLTFFGEQSKHTGNSIETPNSDPEEWRVARDLSWFACEEAEQFVLRYGREIEHLDEVFGFAAQMYRNYAFIFRLGGGERGSNFVAYVPAPMPTGSSVLLDATANIDGVSELCPWRVHVDVPEVRYDNLHIIHAEDYTRKNLTEFFQKPKNRLDYAAHAKNIIRDLMPKGACGLVIVKKKLVDAGLFPKGAAGGSGYDNEHDGLQDDDVERFPWNFEGRHLAVTWWGGHGIGVNDWKKAEYVFQFGEHILPTRTTFAMVQGLRRSKATMGMLWKQQSTNSRPPEVQLAHEGHLLRFMKQMGMRGRARSFDRNGICGPQVLVLTCEFERLLADADRLFPGATLSKWGRTPKLLEKLTQPQQLMEILTDPDAPPSIEASDIAKRMLSVRQPKKPIKWSAVSTNALTPVIKAKVLPNLGWSYEGKRGPGGGSRFVKTGKAVLRPNAYGRPQ